jgi:hypothetical protein
MILVLSQAQIELMRHCRPEVAPDNLRPVLREKTKLILEILSRRFGIYGIEAENIVERTLLLVIQAEQPMYAAHRGRIAEWALEVLKQQIKLTAPLYCQPQMGMRAQWRLEPNIDELELKKRAVFLQKFLEIL